ncbi:MAG TPA: ACP S-malonyltransferase [Candidatus Acidoferrales bacterium]|nr:ACP S-malonyltransferase [Candidatus Acidoferrales bacterium]
MSKIAFLFPGQGSQAAGMGKALADAFPVARAVFEEADRALGFALSRLCFEGPEEELKLTANTQPAVLTCSVAAWRALEERGVRPDYVAGHSLGEYSALVAAGSLSLADAVVTVRKRGEAMQSAVPAGQGAMAAVLGLAREKLEEVCRAAAQGEVVAPANLNSPDQIVVSGHAAAVERAMEAAKAAGAKRAIRLPVSAPFHCALLAPAVAPLEQAFAGVTFHNLRVPLVTNVDADVITTAEQARDALLRQVPAPVRWEESIRKLTALGCDRFVEVGPGKVLTGLLRQIDRNLTGLNVEDVTSLEKTLAALVG